MIARIRGTLIEATFTEAVVECGGVGYLLLIPICTYDKLPPPGNEVALLTEMVVREDAITLYGFATQREKEIFNLLNTVNGIGAKTALNILSSMNIPAFCQAIISADVKSLKAINGVGPKSAERMIVELRDKIRDLSPEALGNAAPAAPVSRAAEDAIKALEQLGFQRAKIQKTVTDLQESLPEKERTVENLIRLALRNLNKS